MSHTPGPWSVVQHKSSWLIVKEDKSGFGVAGIHWRNAEGNANLIAAAPEMLELLEELQWYVDPDSPLASHRCLSCRRRREDQHTDDCWIGNVIKKAKGEQ